MIENLFLGGKELYKQIVMTTLTERPNIFEQ